MPPEFFLDRGLGKRVASDLNALGWIVHRIVDHFPDDAQNVTDPEWVEFGLANGWVPICKDGRIRGIEKEREPVVSHSGVLFYLDNQQLTVSEMVRRFEASRNAINRAIVRGGPAFYAVGNGRIRLTWPPAK